MPSNTKRLIPPKSFMESKVHHKHMRKSRKTRECAVCGQVINKGDLYYQYKPLFKYWQDHCIDHEPRYYEDYYLNN